MTPCTSSSNGIGLENAAALTSLTVDLGRLLPKQYDRLGIAAERLFGPDILRPPLPTIIKADCTYQSVGGGDVKLAIVLNSREFKTSRDAAVDEVDRRRMEAGGLFARQGALWTLKEHLRVINLMSGFEGSD